MVRTFKEAIDLTVDWWIEKSFNTPFNQNNGDISPSGSITAILMNTASISAQSKVTPEQIEKFRSNLTESLLNTETLHRHNTLLDVDCHPSSMLANACKFAGISSSCLPCKSFTRILETNEIMYRYQYGSPMLKI